ncbi:type I secretion system permease/ATPase [Roseibium salinum]
MIEVVEAEQSLLWVSSPASARNASAPKLRVVDGESAADAEDPAEQNRIVNLEAKAAPDARVDPARPVKDQPLPQIPPSRSDKSSDQPSRSLRQADAGGGQGSGTGGGSGGRGGGGGSGPGGGRPAANPNLGKRYYDQNFRDVLTKGLAGCRRGLVTVAIFSFFVNALVLSIPIYLFQISDRVLTSRSTDTLIMLSALVVGFLLIHVLLDMVRRVLLMRIAVETETRLGPSVLSAAARASQNGSNREYQTLGDLQHLRNFITGPVLLTIFDIPIIPIYLLAVYLIHPQLGFIVTCTGGLLLVIALVNQKLTAVPFGQANAYGTRANLQADAMSRNAQVINAMGMIPEGVQIWGRETLESLKAQVIAQDRNVLMSSLSKFIRLCTQIGMLGWGAWLALNSELTGGMLIAASIVGSRALAPIEGAIEGWRGFIQARSSFARIKTLLLNSPLNLERLRLPRAQGRVTVERVLYVPPPTKKVILNGVSFHLEPGESLAIVGASGSGKSTLGRMLVGSIVPTAGNVRLDHMDLRNWDPRQFGESVGYLPQDVQLFPATIKANIARMREDATDEQIYDAADTADVHEMISQFATGYETMIGVDGAPLSGGQKQRIGLARAFFGDPRMVVLDEPNSNLDVPGERALARALTRAKAKEITVIAITQRPSLLRNVDRIMLLKDGTVQALGPRDEMMQVLRNGGAVEGGGASLPPQ